MTVCLWKRFSLFLLLAVMLTSIGCSKKVAAPPPPPPPPPPVAPATPAPTITLTVDRGSITAGQSAVLSYTATNATAVTINPGIGAVQPATTGTRQITPTQTTSFTARATGPGGSSDSAAVNVVVNPVAAPPPPPPPPPPPVTRGSTPNKTLDQLFAESIVPILFDYDKATIRPTEETKLLNNAAWLKQNPTVRFQIEGHADERGSQEYNIALGDERAAAVKKFLAGQGIADARMTTISYGEEKPACREQTEDCWQKSRRAAFVKLP